VDHATNDRHRQREDFLAQSATNCIARAQATAGNHQVDRPSQAGNLTDVSVTFKDGYIVSLLLQDVAEQGSNKASAYYNDVSVSCER
jgi:hypothetical protein